MSKCQNEYPHGDHEPAVGLLCPNHGALLKCEIDEGGLCLVCKEDYQVVLVDPSLDKTNVRSI